MSAVERAPDVAPEHAPIESRVMMPDAQGRLVPRDRIRADLLLQDEMVVKFIRQADALSTSLAAYRKAWFEEVDAFLDLLAQNYTARRSAKGNVTFTSFDGLKKVEVAIGNFISVGPEVQVAKALVEACLNEWSEGANDNLRTIVNDAFEVGKEGKIQVDRLLALRRLDIKDDRWVHAMDAVSDSLRITSSRRYIRMHRRKDTDARWEQVKLDLASV